MKSEIRFLMVVFGMAMAVFLLGHLGNRYALADTGHEGATRLEEGSYVESAAITCSTGNPRELLASDTKRPAISVMNNSAYTLWLGSAAAGTTLLNFGFPVPSSGTFNLQSLTGAISCLADTGAGANGIDARLLKGLVR